MGTCAHKKPEEHRIKYGAFTWFCQNMRYVLAWDEMIDETTQDKTQQNRPPYSPEIHHE